MSRVFIFLVFVVLYGCTTSISKEELKNLNGYWEITEVEFPDGNKKSYAVNPNVDYIKLEGMQGFRKKVQPMFNGTFNISEDADTFQIFQKDEVFVIAYKNNFNEREEQLIQLDSDSFSVKNNENIVYRYKRYEPITLSE